MSASDPHHQAGPQAGQPASPLPQAQPLQSGQPLPQAQPVPQGQPYPQAQPVPQGAGAMPTAQPMRPGQPGAARPVLVQGRGPTTAVRQPGEGEQGEEEISSFALKNAPPWLVSAAFHMLVLIILAVLFLPRLVSNQIELKTIWAEKLGDQLEFDSDLAGLDKDMLEEPVLTPLDLPEVEDPFAAPPDVEIVKDGVTSTSKVDSKYIGMALNGREEGTKRALLGAYGGNALTEAAVKRGLQWLARQQQRDGSWSLTGPYSNGAVNQNETAATAMALLAFQGAGNTHKKGEFKKNVILGWKWLLDEQDADGNFYHEGPFHHRFYTQGQCTIAICELYGMTKDEKYKEPAERAVKYCLRSQSSEGGWRYSPAMDSDVSVTGWVVMALQSARMAKLEVPDDHFRRVERFLDKVAVEGGTRYPYQRGKEATNVMTAEALLCRQYLGWPRDDERLAEAAEWITSGGNLINFQRGRNVYYWYYATQVAHHMEGEYWKRWNGVMRQALPEQQVTKGREAGSWDPLKPTPDEWEDHGGRLYVTCLSIYMLEVYYRHLPIYSNVYTVIGNI